MKRVGWMMILGTVMLAVSTAVSCSKPPEDRVKKVRAAFADLRDVVKADRWAHDEMTSLSGVMDAAEKELSAQDSRFSFNRDYSRAIELFAGAELEIELTRQVALAQKAVLEKGARDGL